MAQYIRIVLSEAPRVGPWALILSGLIVLGARPVARLLGVTWPAAAAVLATPVAIAVITLTPTKEAVAGLINEDRGCVHRGLQPTWLPWPIDGRSLNVWMFVPLGLCCALIWAAPRVRRRWVPATLIPLAVLSPAAIEFTQRHLPLGRTCDTRDIADNLWGLLLGFGAAVALWYAYRRDPTARRLLRVCLGYDRPTTSSFKKTTGTTTTTSTTKTTPTATPSAAPPQAPTTTSATPNKVPPQASTKPPLTVATIQAPSVAREPSLAGDVGKQDGGGDRRVQ